MSGTLRKQKNSILQFNYLRLRKAYQPVPSIHRDRVQKSLFTFYEPTLKEPHYS
jgi:hypothetical protein